MEKIKVLTVVEVAKIFGVSADTIQSWAAKGEIPAKKIGKSWYFDQEQVSSIVKEQND